MKKERLIKVKNLLVSIIKKNYGVLIAIGVAGLFYIMFLSASGTVASMFSEAGESFVGSTYLSADDDITENDASYKDMEDELQDQIDSIEEDYPGYDEYRYQVDEITHDPYSLASYFTAIRRTGTKRGRYACDQKDHRGRKDNEHTGYRSPYSGWRKR